VVLPGGESLIRITHDPRIMKDERGPVLRYVDIFSNDPVAPQVRFAVRANILDQ